MAHSAEALRLKDIFSHLKPLSHKNIKNVSEHPNTNNLQFAAPFRIQFTDTIFIITHNDKGDHHLVLPLTVTYDLLRLPYLIHCFFFSHFNPYALLKEY